MKLTNPTDSELNRVFAEKVCGYNITHDVISGFTEIEGRTMNPIYFNIGEKWSIAASGFNFVEDANAVLPWLEKMTEYELFHDSRALDHYMCEVYWAKEGESVIHCFAMDSSFARAAVIALLRAHGVEVETSNQ